MRPASRVPSMVYYLNLFSPETYEGFSRSDRTVTGFRMRHRAAANRVKPGSKLICYMTRLSRWVGILEVESKPLEDRTPIFFEDNDPFTVRFRVKPVAWLSKEKAIPIYEEEVWTALTFTKEHNPGTTTW